MEYVEIWEITGDNLKEIKQAKLHLEERDQRPTDTLCTADSTL